MQTLQLFQHHRSFLILPRLRKFLGTLSLTKAFLIGLPHASPERETRQLLSLPVSKTKETELHRNHFSQGDVAIEGKVSTGMCQNVKCYCLSQDGILRSRLLRQGFEGKQLILEAIPGRGEMRDRREGGP